jgi:hypothetical protein
VKYQFGIVLMLAHTLFPTAEKLYYCVMARPSYVIKPERFAVRTLRDGRPREVLAYEHELVVCDLTHG